MSTEHRTQRPRRRRACETCRHWREDEARRTQLGRRGPCEHFGAQTYEHQTCGHWERRQRPED